MLVTCSHHPLPTTIPKTLIYQPLGSRPRSFTSVTVSSPPCAWVSAWLVYSARIKCVTRASGLVLYGNVLEQTDFPHKLWHKQKTEKRNNNGTVHWTGLNLKIAKALKKSHARLNNLRSILTGAIYTSSRPSYSKTHIYLLLRHTHTHALTRA